MYRDEVAPTVKWLDEYFKFLLPKSRARKVSDLIDLATKAVKSMGINGVVFDPWNMIDPTRKSGITETEHIRDSLESFKAFARECNVSVYIVAHPNKPLKEPGGKIPVPTAYDISGSAHWYNISDNIISVWRNPEEISTPVEIHIQKVRFGEVGISGTQVNLDFNRATGVYTDISYAVNVDKKKDETVKEFNDRVYND